MLSQQITWSVRPNAVMRGCTGLFILQKQGGKAWESIRSIIQPAEGCQDAAATATPFLYRRRPSKARFSSGFPSAGALRKWFRFSRRRSFSNARSTEPSGIGCRSALLTHPKEQTSPFSIKAAIWWSARRPRQSAVRWIVWALGRTMLFLLHIAAASRISGLRSRMLAGADKITKNNIDLAGTPPLIYRTKNLFFGK